MQTPLAFTGARAIVSFNSEPMAWCVNASYNIETPHEEISAIDSSLPQELAPKNIRVSGTFTMIRVAKKTSATLLGISPTIGSLLTDPYISIEIKDRATDDTILFLPRCKIMRRSGQVSAKSMGSEQWDFISIGYWDEMSPGTNGQ